jgi:uncharacterized membrane protein
MSVWARGAPQRAERDATGVRAQRACRRAAVRRRSRGSIAIFAALAIVIAVASLGVLDLANLYSARRALQNVADFAALAAVQQMDDGCAQPLATATANAASNGFVANGATRTFAVSCGRWDANGSGGMTFVSDGTPPLNGVQVSVTNTVPYFFAGPARQIAASATAKASVVGSFQVGTSLVEANLLNGMLGALLGTKVQLDAVSWNGIANANVKVADLAAVATSAGTYDGLLATQTTVAGLASILLNAVNKDAALTADVSAAQNALNAMTALVPRPSSKPIQLAALSGSTALLQLGVANAEYAASATVNVLQMLIAGAEIAAAGQPPVAFNLDLTGLPGVLPASVALTLQVISPPAIAVGEPGYIAGTSTWRTQARTAQILLGVNAGISTAQTGSLLGNVLAVTVQLPLYVVAAQGQAWLASAQCAASKAASTQTIGVQTGVANLCIGAPPAAGVSAGDVSGFNCSGTNGPWTVASVTVPLLSLDLATVSAPSIGVPVVNPASATLVFDGSGNPLAGNSVNSNAVGAVLDNTLQSTAATLGNLTVGNGLQLTLLNVPLAQLLGSTLIGGAVMPLVTDILSKSLGPALTGLDDVILGPLLQLLGVQIGVATVTSSPLSCGVATLVQ